MTRIWSCGIVSADDHGSSSGSVTWTPFESWPYGATPGSSSRRSTSSHGPVALTTARALDGEDLTGQPVVHLGAGHGAVDRGEVDHLGVVEDRRAGLGGGRHVGEAQAAVVRPRVLVDATAA